MTTMQATAYPMALVLKLPDLAQHAVGKLECSRGGIIRPAVPGETSPDPDLFPDVVDEQLPVVAGPSERDRRVGLKRPVRDLAGRVPDVHVEIRVGTLPIELGQDSGEIATVL